MLNPNDLLSQIGFLVDTPQKQSFSCIKQKRHNSQRQMQGQFQGIYKTIQQQFMSTQYVTSLQIQLSENQNHVLQILSYDDPHLLAQRFCDRHNLNKLAVQIVESKIIQAKNKQEQKLRQNARQCISNNNALKAREMNRNQKVPQNNCNQQFLKNAACRQRYQDKAPLNQEGQNASGSVTPLKRQRSVSALKNKGKLMQQQKPSGKNSQIKKTRNQLKLDKACENLYFRGVLQAKALQQKRVRRQQQKQRQQEQGLTFKPRINQVSEKIIEFRKQTGTVRPRDPNKTKNQVTQKIYKQLKECTFTPQINTISKIIVHNRQAYRTESEHFNQLFNNTQPSDRNNNTFKSHKLFNAEDNQYVNKKSKLYLKMQQEAEEKQMFRPKINSRCIQEVRQPFEVRLEKAIQIKQRIKEGEFGANQFSFQPKVGRAPYYQLSRGQNAKNNKQNIPVWEQLYRQSQNRVKNKQKLQQDNLRQLTNTTNSRASFNSSNAHNSKNSLVFSERPSSNLHYENLIQRRINMVFQLLDSDSDGMISPNTIGIENLSKSTLIFLKPIFEQMDDSNAELNYNQFKKAVINLLNDSDPYKKGLFLSDNNKKINNEHSFIPQINPKSKLMIQGRHTSQIHQQLYEQGVKDLHRKQFMLQKQRAKKQQKQLQQCSFKPSLKLGGKCYQPHILNKKFSDVQIQPNSNTYFQNENSPQNNYKYYEQ